jgi:hypothetical protein
LDVFFPRVIGVPTDVIAIHFQLKGSIFFKGDVLLKEPTPPINQKISLPKPHILINYQQNGRKIQWIVSPDLRTPGGWTPWGERRGGRAREQSSLFHFHGHTKTISLWSPSNRKLKAGGIVIDKFAGIM